MPSLYCTNDQYQGGLKGICVKRRQVGRSDDRVRNLRVGAYLRVVSENGAIASWEGPWAEDEGGVSWWRRGLRCCRQQSLPAAVPAPHHPDRLERTHHHALRTPRAAGLVMQQRSLVSHAIGPFRLQPQHMRRAGRDAAPAAGAAVRIDEGQGRTAHGISSAAESPLLFSPSATIPATARTVASTAKEWASCIGYPEAGPAPRAILMFLNLHISGRWGG